MQTAFTRARGKKLNASVAFPAHVQRLPHALRYTPDKGQSYVRLELNSLPCGRGVIVFLQTPREVRPQHQQQGQGRANGRGALIQAQPG